MIQVQKNEQMKGIELVFVNYYGNIFTIVIYYSNILHFKGIMGKYPKKRKPSGKTKCTLCGKTFCARGIGSHNRQVHGMVVKTVNKYISSNDSIAVNNDAFTTVKPSAEVKELSNKTVKNLSGETGKNLSECTRPDGSKLYTEQDVWILLSKLYQATQNEDPGNLLSVFNTNDLVSSLIKDFERRFSCKFEDVKKAHPNVHPGTTNVENYKLIKDYASLNYSS
jgi:hypothetical protein